MDSESRIYVAGNTGLVGSAIVRYLFKKGYKNIISSPSSYWDLRRQSEVERFFELNKPEYVFLSAARVGGIMDNKTYPGEFIYDNLMIQNNVIHCSKLFEVKKLLFLGSSCIYPKMAKQPITEDQLMDGPLEETNDAYAIAKIAGIKMCQAYKKEYGLNAISLMPTNLYGPNDNFDPISSHVLPGFIAKFHAAKINNEPYVKCWGDGSPYREFLHVDDLADASIFCMNNYNDSDIINVGTGEDITIKELAEKIRNIVGYKGEIEWDISKPNGTPRKLLNVDKIKSIGWNYSIELNEGIKKTYNWYLEASKK